ncbi:MAG TPA: type II toxin-antitoxin system prevent-host-death family antitoxin [Rhizomicrobium sp.]|jgi:prevent-host-death family protein|nr:type II toxin-antitoxin system prevent-host-death family antitoxin [Rhizomicrobium sp.]
MAPRYAFGMTIVSITDAERRLAELAQIVERGETVVVTQDGKPVFDLVPHPQNSGLRLGAIAEFKRKYGIDEIFPYVADDFDAPMPEDILLKPLR